MTRTETTRRKIYRILQNRPEPLPTAISNALKDEDIKISPDEVVEEIKELNKSIEQEIHVSPPQCKDCGFEDWDTYANIPSSCPRCKSEWIEEPRFKLIEDVE